MDHGGERRTSSHRRRVAEPPQRSQSGFVDRFRLSVNVSGEPAKRPTGNPLRRWLPSPAKERETRRHAAPVVMGGAGRAVPTSSPLGPERLSPVLQPHERRSASPPTKKAQPPTRRPMEPIRKQSALVSLPG